MNMLGDLIDDLEINESLLESKKTQIPIGQYSVDLGIIDMLVNLSKDKVEMQNYIRSYFHALRMRKEQQSE